MKTRLKIHRYFFPLVSILLLGMLSAQPQIGFVPYNTNEYYKAFYPLEIEGQEWRAISWTTAASIAAVIEMVEKGDLPEQGFIKQEEISYKKLIETSNGKYYVKGDLEGSSKE